MYTCGQISFAFASRRQEDIDRKFDRIECEVRNYPPINDTVSLAENLIKLAYIAPQIFCRDSFAVSGMLSMHITHSYLQK